MVRELTAEGRFESGLNELLAGKRHAFLAVIGDRFPAALGVAVEHEPGYYPVPEVWAHSDCMREMQLHADRLNSAMRIDDREAAKIVATTFAAGKVDQTAADRATRQRLAARRAAREAQA